MFTHLLATLLIAAAFAGCATGRSEVTSDGVGSNIAYSLEQTGSRSLDAFRDPIRRQHVITQVGRLTSTASVAIGCVAIVPPPFSLFVCPIVATLYNYGAYEFILEPISRELVKQGKPSLVGPYWETGPRDGERFQLP